jgi:lipopolysaccharide/colanic/teichoic acid biosynthesis glycosyltransferase
MLDVPYASRDLTFEPAPAVEPDTRRTVRDWQPTLFLEPSWRLDAKARLFKRLVDICAASLGLVMITPVALCVALAIRMESPGPVLFRQTRVGLHCLPFTLLKFRTMRHAPQPTGRLRQATMDDPRVTRFGRWLRRHSVDELPQLINVLRGDMSIVGPRPHAPGTCAAGRLFEDVSTRYAARHCVKPGMTGLAQIRGWRGETDTEDKLLRRIESDLEYIATWSIGLDLRIIWRTAGSVFGGRNAW